MAPPDWTALPSDAIFAISTHIADDADHVRFRSVCSSFRSAAPKRPQIPYILHLRGHDIGTITLRLANLPSTDLFPAAALPADLSCRKYFCGSSLGWIALLDDKQSISLHNPFTADHIPLPLIPELPWVQKSGDFYIPTGNIDITSKVVLSSDPRLPGCVALAMSDYRTRLMYCRSQGASWTVFPTLATTNARNNQIKRLGAFVPRKTLDDFVYYKGKFYAVDGCEVSHFDDGTVHYLMPNLFVWEVGSGNAEFSQLLPMAMGPYTETNFGVELVRNLVVSSGDLLLVTCSYRSKLVEGSWKSYVHCFEVIRVDLECGEGRMSLVKLDNLGGCSIFLGKSGSMSVPSGASPWCKQNCIYYVEGTKLKDKLMVYSMEDGSIEPIDVVACFTNDSFVRSDSMTDDSDSEDDQIFRYWEFGWFAPSLC